MTEKACNTVLRMSIDESHVVTVNTGVDVRGLRHGVTWGSCESRNRIE